MPIYVTTEKPTGEQLLVDAASEAAALKHVSTNRFDVEIVRNTGDVARLMSKGVKLQTAGETPEPEAPPKDETETENEQTDKTKNPPKSPPPGTGGDEG